MRGPRRLVVRRAVPGGASARQHQATAKSAPRARRRATSTAPTSQAAALRPGDAALVRGERRGAGPRTGRADAARLRVLRRAGQMRRRRAGSGERRGCRVAVGGSRRARHSRRSGPSAVGPATRSPGARRPHDVSVTRLKPSESAERRIAVGLGRLGLPATEVGLGRPDDRTERHQPRTPPMLAATGATFSLTVELTRLTVPAASRPPP